jgi:hypothetical protein
LRAAIFRVKLSAICEKGAIAGCTVEASFKPALKTSDSRTRPHQVRSRATLQAGPRMNRHVCVRQIRGERQCSHSNRQWFVHPLKNAHDIIATKANRDLMALLSHLSKLIPACPPEDAILKDHARIRILWKRLGPDSRNSAIQ